MPDYDWKPILSGSDYDWSPVLVVGVGSAPSITTTTVAEGSVGVPYSTTLLAAGDAPITWAVASGTLPAGLALSSGGTLSGTPTTPVAAAFTVSATNGFGSDTQLLTLMVPNAADGGGDINADSLVSSYSLTPSTALYTITGNAVQLRYTPGAMVYTLDPGTGTFTLTANPVSTSLRHHPNAQWQVVISVQSPNWTITDT
jgi:hypothetical protein